VKSNTAVGSKPTKQSGQQSPPFVQDLFSEGPGWDTFVDMDEIHSVGVFVLMGVGLWQYLFAERFIFLR